MPTKRKVPVLTVASSTSLSSSDDDDELPPPSAFATNPPLRASSLIDKKPKAKHANVAARGVSGEEADAGLHGDDGVDADDAENRYNGSHSELDSDSSSSSSASSERSDVSPRPTMMQTTAQGCVEVRDSSSASGDGGRSRPDRERAPTAEAKIKTRRKVRPSWSPSSSAPTSSPPSPTCKVASASLDGDPTLGFNQSCREFAISPRRLCTGRGIRSSSDEKEKEEDSDEEEDSDGEEEALMSPRRDPRNDAIELLDSDSDDDDDVEVVSKSPSKCRPPSVSPHNYSTASSSSSYSYSRAGTSQAQPARSRYGKPPSVSPHNYSTAPSSSSYSYSRAGTAQAQPARSRSGTPSSTPRLPRESESRPTMASSVGTRYQIQHRSAFISPSPAHQSASIATSSTRANLAAVGGAAITGYGVVHGFPADVNVRSKKCASEKWVRRGLPITSADSVIGEPLSPAEDFLIKTNLESISSSYTKASSIQIQRGKQHKENWGHAEAVAHYKYYNEQRVEVEIKVMRRAGFLAFYLRARESRNAAPFSSSTAQVIPSASAGAAAAGAIAARDGRHLSNHSDQGLAHGDHRSGQTPLPPRNDEAAVTNLYMPYVGKHLKAILRENDQMPHADHVAELRQRVVDGYMHGPLKKSCPKCKKGRLRFQAPHRVVCVGTKVCTNRGWRHRACEHNYSCNDTEAPRKSTPWIIFPPPS